MPSFADSLKPEEAWDLVHFLHTLRQPQERDWPDDDHRRHPRPPEVTASWPPDAQFGKANPAKLAMWIFLLSDWLSFAGLLLAYGILRAGSAVWRHPGEPALNIPFTCLLTLVLIASSISVIVAHDAALGRRPPSDRALAGHHRARRRAVPPRSVRRVDRASCTPA